MASLQSRLDEFKRAFESGAPPYNAPHEVIETMHRATAELKATGIEERALKGGDRARGFSLFNQDHVQIDSANLIYIHLPPPHCSLFWHGMRRRVLGSQPYGRYFPL